MITTAIILAGGFGTRLRTVITDLPKPMAPVNELPFLNYQLNYLKHFGIKKVIISTGHLSEKITEYYKNSFNGMSVEYVHESTPLGTGGGIRLAAEKCKDTEAIVLNGDSFFDVNLNEFYKQHQINKVHFSIAVRQVKEASRYGTILLGHFSENTTSADLNKVISFQEKNGEVKEGIINGGIYIIDTTKYIELTKPEINFSIEKDFFEIQCKQQNIAAFKSEGYFIDIGVPEDYLKAQNDFKEFKYR